MKRPSMTSPPGKRSTTTTGLSVASRYAIPKSSAPLSPRDSKSLGVRASVPPQHNLSGSSSAKLTTTLPLRNSRRNLNSALESTTTAAGLEMIPTPDPSPRASPISSTSPNPAYTRRLSAPSLSRSGVSPNDHNSGVAQTPQPVSAVSQRSLAADSKQPPPQGRPQALPPPSQSRYGHEIFSSIRSLQHAQQQPDEKVPQKEMEPLSNIGVATNSKPQATVRPTTLQVSTATTKRATWAGRWVQRKEEISQAAQTLVSSTSHTISNNKLDEDFDSILVPAETQGGVQISVQEEEEAGGEGGSPQDRRLSTEDVSIPPQYSTATNGRSALMGELQTLEPPIVRTHHTGNPAVIRTTFPPSMNPFLYSYEPLSGLKHLPNAPSDMSFTKAHKLNFSSTTQHPDPFNSIVVASQEQQRTPASPQQDQQRSLRYSSIRSPVVQSSVVHLQESPAQDPYAVVDDGRRGAGGRLSTAPDAAEIPLQGLVSQDDAAEMTNKEKREVLFNHLISLVETHLKLHVDCVSSLASITARLDAQVVAQKKRLAYCEKHQALTSQRAMEVKAESLRLERKLKESNEVIERIEAENFALQHQRDDFRLQIMGAQEALETSHELLRSEHQAQRENQIRSPATSTAAAADRLQSSSVSSTRRDLTSPIPTQQL